MKAKRKADVKTETHPDFKVSSWRPATAPDSFDLVWRPWQPSWRGTGRSFEFETAAGASDFLRRGPAQKFRWINVVLASAVLDSA